MKVARWLVLFALCAAPALAQIPIDQLHIQNSPDVRNWAPTGNITKIEFWRGAGIHIEYDKHETWPDVIPPGWDGPIQYTVWMLLKIDGQWYGSGVIECWRDRPSTDDADVTTNNHIAAEWFYDGRWGPLQGHQPQPGERVGLMLTAGDARGKDVHGVAERTGIIEIAWPATSGVSPQVLWTENRSTPPVVVEPPPIVNTPPPIVNVPPVYQPPAPLPSVDLSGLYSQMAVLNVKLDALAQSVAASRAENGAFYEAVKSQWKAFLGKAAIYAGPIIGAIFAGRATKGDSN